MIYLNDVEEGGATWFPQAGFRVEPRPGLLLAWNNMDPDGKPNVNTLHEGMPVLKGVKYIVTKWFRESELAAGLNSTSPRRRPGPLAAKARQ